MQKLITDPQIHMERDLQCRNKILGGFELLNLNQARHSLMTPKGQTTKGKKWMNELNPIKKSLCLKEYYQKK